MMLSSSKVFLWRPKTAPKHSTHLTVQTYKLQITQKLDMGILTITIMCIEQQFFL